MSLTTLLKSVKSTGRPYMSFYEWELSDGSGRNFARSEAKIVSTKIDSDARSDTAMGEAHDLVLPQIDAEFFRMGTPLYVQSSRTTSAWVPVVVYSPAEEGCVPGPIRILKSILPWGGGKDYFEVIGGVEEKGCVPVHRGPQSMMPFGEHVLYAYPVELAADPIWEEPTHVATTFGLSDYREHLPRETRMALWSAEHRDAMNSW